jgi:hypothetical protein
MTTISNFLLRIANWKTLAAFFAAYLLFVGLILKNAETRINELAGKTVGVIDLTFGFHPQRTLQMVADYGEVGRAFYARTEMTADVAYPLVYAFFFGIIMTLLYRGTRYARLNVLPFAALLFDYAENVNIVTLLHTFPQQSMTVATFCEVFKCLKWLTFAAIILLTVAGLVSKLLNRRTLSVA